MRPTMEVETSNCWRRRRILSLSLPQRGNCKRNFKTFSSKRKRHLELAPVVRTVTAPLQTGQIIGIIASLPAIKRLAADAEVAAGAGHITAVTIEIHPGQPYPGFPAELRSGPGQSV